MISLLTFIFNGIRRKRFVIGMEFFEKNLYPLPGTVLNVVKRLNVENAQ